ncbi:DUF2946 family protein [Achromobacter sp. F4_2707]|uniref:DUF2946 family protein n=1 Tax=Achromobacter sp. F4_2707 TaxID=3114286 RepID=UPI0039C6B02C
MAVWQILFCLTAFSFLCRAVIPVGYMPDLSGERDTPFAITLCSMGGTVVVQLDLDGSEKSSSDQHYGGDTCPFGLNVAHKLIPGQATLALAGMALFLSVASPAARQALPPLPALGPPLGSRAPPVGV